jgi:hypothetical protein
MRDGHDPVHCIITDRALKLFDRLLELSKEPMLKAFDEHRAAIEAIASAKFDARRIEFGDRSTVVITMDDVNI